jgi:hypothetical protein
MIRKVGTGFRKRSCVSKKLKRDDDSKKSHRTLSHGPGASAMHGSAFSAAIGLAVLAVTPSQGACLKPDAPNCALERVPFASDKAADDCRKDVMKFRDAMDRYATCLADVSADQEKAARDDYEDVRVRFNKRARGEFDQPSR